MSNIIGVRNNNTIVPLSSGSTMPAGTIIAYSGSIAAFISTASADSTTLVHKDGWAVCNGASIARTTYADLYARVAATWNTTTNPLTGSAQGAPADTATNFRIPNLQGTFLRSVGDFSDNTKDTTLAGFQADQVQGHIHSLEAAGGGSLDFIQNISTNNTGFYANTYYTNVTPTGKPVTDGTNGTPRTGTETRPQNVGVYYLIKLYDNLAAVDVYIAPASATEVGLVTTGAQTFGGDKILTGNTSLDGGSFVFNESGADKDFRVEGDNNQNLLFCDASTDRIGIGTNTPGRLLHVNGQGVIGSNNILSASGSGIANNGTFTLATGASFFVIGILTAHNASDSNGNVNTSSTYFVCRRGTAVTATLLASGNGQTGGFSFTITVDSSYNIVLTNTGGSASSAILSFVGLAS